ncbi:hypothetical protein [Saccharopolyspora pogona]|uniref:hypothetical protein n=1 Tax=Saccharopolyspora pogona TaxID=333966 RepID=UPI001686A1A4|nr:hypothetical protein [Saccharopolyspora pogona]
MSILGSPRWAAGHAGTTALFYVAAGLLHRVSMGDHPELAEPLRHLLAELER